MRQFANNERAIGGAGAVYVGSWYNYSIRLHQKTLYQFLQFYVFQMYLATCFIGNLMVGVSQDVLILQGEILNKSYKLTLLTTKYRNRKEIGFDFDKNHRKKSSKMKLNSKCFILMKMSPDIESFDMKSARCTLVV